MQNCSKCYPTLDEFITELSKMCPIVDSKDNVVYLKQVKEALQEKVTILLQFIIFIFIF
jgi:hypothetical protein